MRRCCTPLIRCCCSATPVCASVRFDSSSSSSVRRRSRSVSLLESSLSILSFSVRAPASSRLRGPIFAAMAAKSRSNRFTSKERNCWDKSLYFSAFCACRSNEFTAFCTSFTMSLTLTRSSWTVSSFRYASFLRCLYFVTPAASSKRRRRSSVRSLRIVSTILSSITEYASDPMPVSMKRSLMSFRRQSVLLR